MPSGTANPKMRSDDHEPVLAMRAPARHKDNPLTRSKPGLVGLAVLIIMFIACIGTLPWTLESVDGVPRYDAGAPVEGRLPPAWLGYDDHAIERANNAVDRDILAGIAESNGTTVEALVAAREGDPELELIRPHWPAYLLGSDLLGRSLAVRLLAGGGISLSIGIAAALLSVSIGTIYGALAGYVGGTLDSVMMRVVDVLYGLPYILLVVLLAVASNAMLDEWVTRSKAKESWMRTQVIQMADQRGEDMTKSEAVDVLATDQTLREDLLGQANQRYPARDLSVGQRTALDVLTLLIAIGGVSWLTMARVIRGQVLSLKNQPFVEAARAVGSSPVRIFARHLLPNLIGPIIVYATLTVPQAILQESFLSFLGIGVKPPLPSWGNLAAEGLGEINTYRSHWWLLFFPCLLLGITLLSMNFVGEGLREAFDPKRSR